MASPRSGTVLDRGSTVQYVDKPLVFKDASWIDPEGSVSLFEDFLSAHGTLATGNCTITQGGTPATAAALNATAGPAPVGQGGWVAGSVQAADDEIDEVALGGVTWINPTRAGNGMAVCEFGFVVPVALTARRYFAGFGTATTAAGADGTLSIVTGITLVDGSGTGDGAGFVYSSTATDVDGWYIGAVKATVVGTAVNSGLTAIVDNYQKLRVEIDSDGNVFFFGGVDDASTPVNRAVPVGFVGSAAAAVTANELYIPIFSAASTTTTAVEWEVDYIFGACAA